MPRAGPQDPNQMQVENMAATTPNALQNPAPLLLQQDGRTFLWPAPPHGLNSFSGLSNHLSRGCELPTLSGLAGPGGNTSSQAVRLEGELEPVWEYPLRIIGSPEAAHHDSTQRNALTFSAHPSLLQPSAPTPQLGIRSGTENGKHGEAKTKSFASPNPGGASGETSAQTPNP
ncbi:hypothetical protein R1flu_003251 [Riccia fluitans]|uniref:Uncharacterized protein n=1 Tax=Riccia fluitans TaxID=41844 RepID=A0ABD1Y8H3_9MARC